MLEGYGAGADLRWRSGGFEAMVSALGLWFSADIRDSTSERVLAKGHLRGRQFIAGASASYELARLGDISLHSQGAVQWQQVVIDDARHDNYTSLSFADDEAMTANLGFVVRGADYALSFGYHHDDGQAGVDSDISQSFRAGDALEASFAFAEKELLDNLLIRAEASWRRELDNASEDSTRGGISLRYGF